MKEHSEKLAQHTSPPSSCQEAGSLAKPDAAMDRSIHLPRGEPVTLSFDGRQHRAYAGEPLAVGLYAAGVKVLSRSLKYHRPRAFFCLAGHCGACLMRVNGLPNIKSCQVACHEGMA